MDVTARQKGTVSSAVPLEVPYSETRGDKDGRRRGMESPAVLLFRKPMQERGELIRGLIEQKISEGILVYLSDPQRSHRVLNAGQGRGYNQRGVQRISALSVYLCCALFVRD